MQTLQWKNSLLWLTGVLTMLLPLCSWAQIEQVINHATCPGKNTGWVELRIAKDVYPKLNFTITDGRGIVQVKENVSARSLEFSNLYAGTYTIKIDIPGVTGCRLKDYSDVIPSQDLELRITELVKPTTTTAADGKISVAGFGGSNNYRYRWENGATTNNRTSLRVGDYTVTLTDLNTGCELVQSIRLETECSAFKVIVEKIVPPSQDNALDGSIKVSGSAPRNIFSWSTGENTAEITKKPAGNYTVEILDLNTGCSATETFQLLSCASREGLADHYSFKIITRTDIPYPIGNIPQVEILCYNDPLQEPLSVNDKFTVSWKDKQTGVILGRGAVLPSVSNIHKEIIVELNDGCKTYVVETLKVNCGNANYDGVPPVANITSKPACPGSDEGSALLEFPFPSKQIVKIELMQGTLVIKELYFAKNNNNLSLLISNLKPNIDYKINITFHPNAIFGEPCNTGMIFKIPALDIKKSDVRYNNKSRLCEYSEICNGIQIGGTFNLKEVPKFDLDDLDGCRIKKVICGNQTFKEDIGGIENMRIGEAWEFLEQFPGHENEHVYNFLKGKDPCGHVGLCLFDPFRGSFSWNFDEKEIRRTYDPNTGCTTYRCGQLLTLLRSKFTACPSSRRPPLPVDENGVAPINKIPDPSVPRTCIQKKVSLLEMVIAHYNGKLTQFYGSKYKGSALERLIKSMDVYNPRIRCAKVTFCENDLNQPVFTDINQVNQLCGQFLMSIDGVSVYKCDINLIKTKYSNNPIEEFYIGGTSQAALTSELGQAILNKALINVAFTCGTYDAGGLQLDTRSIETVTIPRPVVSEEVEILSSITEDDDSISVEPITTLILDSLHHEQLQDFGSITYLGKTIPKGLIKSDRGFHAFNYSYGDAFVEKINLTELTHFQQNWDREQSVAISVDSPKTNYKLIYLDTLTDWNKSITSSSYLKIHHLSFTDTTILVGGTVNGSFKYNDNSISTTTDLSAFILSIDTSGLLHSFNLIENIDTTRGIYFSENRAGKIMVATAFKNSNLLLNGLAYNPGTSEGLLLCEWSNGQFSPLKVIQPNAASKWKGVSLNAAADQINIAITSADSLRISGDRLASNAGSNVVLAALSAQGTLKWQHRIQDSSLQVNKMGIVSDDAQGLLFALTYRDSLNLSGKRYTSAGQDDVLLGKLDAQGSLKWSRSVGTVDQEEVSQVSYSSGLFFYGGQFSGATKLRPMGEVWYDNRTTHNDRVYISFVIDSTYVPDTTTQVPNTEAVYIPMDKAQQVNPLQVRTPQLETPEVQVYPNPFRNEVTIEYMLNSAANYNLRLIDNLGVSLKSIPLAGQVGYNAQTLQTNNLPRGMYFLQLTDSVGRLVKTLRIVKL